MKNMVKTARNSLALLALAFAFLLFACGEEQATVKDDLTLAREYMRHRDFIEAEKSYERYLRTNPNGEDRLEVWNQLVELALNVRHNRNSAIELMEAMLIEYEHQPEICWEIQEKLATEYDLARRYDRSLELWGQLLQNPGTPSVKKAAAYRNVSQIYLRRLEFELAKESLDYCLKLDVPLEIKAHCQYDLANAHMIMEDTEAGIAELRKLLSNEALSDDLRVLSVFMLADALEHQGKNDTALTLFKSIRQTYPNTRVIEARIEYLTKDMKKKN